MKLQGFMEAVAGKERLAELQRMMQAQSIPVS